MHATQHDNTSTAHAPTAVPAHLHQPFLEPLPNLEPPLGPRRAHTWLGLCVVGLVALGTVVSFLPRPTPAFAPSRVQPQQMLINGAAQAGGNRVAAGELGHLFFNPQDSQQWHEASVTPQRGSTLTQVFFANKGLGLAVGHDSWILRSEDAGQSWKEVNFDADAGTALMSVWGNPSGPFFAVGGFGALWVSDDQGKTWQKRDAGLGDRHFYGVAGAGPSRMMIVGEGGLVARSEDGGQHWSHLDDFYNGSLFGLIALSPDNWLVYGMRGKVFRSQDFGQSWTPVNSGTQLALYGGTLTHDGRVVLVGEGGVVIVSADGGETFSLLHDGGGASLSSVGETSDGQWMLTGQQGIALETPPTTPSNH